MTSFDLANELEKYATHSRSNSIAREREKKKDCPRSMNSYTFFLCGAALVPFQTLCKKMAICSGLRFRTLAVFIALALGYFSKEGVMLYPILK